jgi:hypothetical protein
VAGPGPGGLWLWGRFEAGFDAVIADMAVNWARGAHQMTGSVLVVAVLTVVAAMIGGMLESTDHRDVRWCESALS